MGALAGRVAVITGAGRGLGREHALLLAAEGAKVVVNDLGGSTDGTGNDAGPAQQVVDEIIAAGGEAVANTDDIADWEGGARLVQTAIDAFGQLDVLVNNAGILRDRMLVNMSEQEWDAIMHVHLRGHFVPTRHAAAHWRERSKAQDGPVAAAVINTASGAGLFNNFGQTNYAAAKAGIATFGMVAAMELARYGVRVNTIAPLARTRLTLQTPGMGDVVAPPEDPNTYDPWAPSNVSPLVAYLAMADCPFTGGVFHVGGGEVGLVEGWRLGELIVSPDEKTWKVEDLATEAKKLLDGRPELASQGTTLNDSFAGFTKRYLS